MRITTAEVAALTGLPLRTARHFLATGAIPSAARLGKRLTANRSAVMEWIAKKEIRSCPSTNAAMSGGASCITEAGAIDAAYTQALGLKQQSA